MLKRQAGIGLLELMLALAIIAILLIMATRYYQSASRSNSLSETVDMVNAVRGAVGNFIVANPNIATYPYIGSLVNAGYLPGSYGTGGSAQNPYGGGLCISDIAASSCSSTATTGPTMGASYAIIVTGVPIEVCEQLAKQIQATLAVNSVYSNCSGTTFIRVTYTH